MQAHKLSSNEQEAVNRAEVVALLIRTGHRVYRPEADCGGADLVVRTPGGNMLAVQLKSRATVDWKRYGARHIWMLFPEPLSAGGEHAAAARPWFLLPHDDLFDWLKQRHGHTSGWAGAWSTPYISKRLRQYLAPFRVRQPTP